MLSVKRLQRIGWVGGQLKQTKALQLAGGILKMYGIKSACICAYLSIHEYMCTCTYISICLYTYVIHTHTCEYCI